MEVLVFIFQDVSALLGGSRILRVKVKVSIQLAVRRQRPDPLSRHAIYEVTKNNKLSPSLNLAILDCLSLFACMLFSFPSVSP